MLVSLLVGLCFIISGACGLIYETVWVKQLSYVFGNTVTATTLVFAAFMGGLALGSSTLGAWADRSKRPLKLYGWLEMGITLSAMAFGPLLGVVRQMHAKVLAIPSLPGWVPFAFEFVALLLLMVIPTALMGATLPILCRWATRAGGHTGRSMGILYALNSAGAVVGGILAGFVLVRNLGLNTTAVVAMALNVLVGLIALVLDFMHASGEDDAPAVDAPAATGKDVPAPDVLPDGDLAPGTLHAAIFVCGFAAMLFEITLMKVLPLILGSSTHSFSLMVSAFIAGIALGSAFMGWMMPRLQRPVTVLALLLTSAALVFMVTIPLHNGLPLFYLWLRVHFAATSFTLAQVVAFVVCFVVMGIPSFLIGGVLPVAVHLATRRDASSVAASVGRIYAWNTTGNILGTMLTGLLLVPRLGFKTSMEIGVILLAIAGLALFRAAEGGRYLGRAVMVTVLLTAGYLAVYPRVDVAALTAGVFRPMNAQSGNLSNWVHQHREFLFSEEDEHAFVTVERTASSKGDLSLRVNGKAEASTGVDMPNQKLAAHIPLVLHPDPKKAFILGLGCGATVAAALKHPLESLECLEISPAVIRASQFFAPYIGDIRSDKRLQLIQDDGRAFLEHSPTKYDVIISEPSNPWFAGIASLYTREFFLTERAHLAPGGLMLQWVHIYEMNMETFRVVVRTFRTVFPHVQMFRVNGGDVLMVGSEGPILLDPEAIRRGIERPGVKEDLASLRVNTPLIFLGHHLVAAEHVEELAGFGLINIDDCPVLEYMAPEAFYSRSGMTLSDLELRILPEENPVKKLLKTYTPGSQEVLDFCSRMESDYGIRILIGMLDEALERSPDSLELHLRRGAYLASMGDHRAAMTDLDIVWAKAPETPGLVDLRFETASKLEGDRLSFTRPRTFDVALETAQFMVAQSPEDLEAQGLLAAVHFNRREWPVAEAKYRSLLEKRLGMKDPPEADQRLISAHFLMLAICRLEQGDPQGAVEILNRRAREGHKASSDSDLEAKTQTRLELGLRKQESGG